MHAMKKQLLILATALLAAAGAQASCYTVLGPKGDILSQSPNPPVNMSRPLHETVTNKYGPGAHMVFGIAEADCGQRVETWGNDGTVKKTAASAKKNGKARRKAPAKPQQPAQAEPASAPAQAQPPAQAEPPKVHAEPKARKSRSQRETGQVRLRQPKQPASAAAQ